MGLPAGFQKAYDMAWYFSNYGKELSCHIPTQILPPGSSQLYSNSKIPRPQCPTNYDQIELYNPGLATNYYI